jgi:hypothetical protein
MFQTSANLRFVFDYDILRELYYACGAAAAFQLSTYMCLCPQNHRCFLFLVYRKRKGFVTGSRHTNRRLKSFVSFASYDEYKSDEDYAIIESQVTPIGLP